MFTVGMNASATERTDPQGSSSQPVVVLYGSRLAPKASGAGLAAAAVLTGIAIATGKLPEGGEIFVIYGALAAALLGCIGTSMKAFAVALPPTDPKASQRFLMAVISDFLLQLLTIGTSVLAMFLADVKFSDLVCFALAFAGAAFAFQLSASFILSRALHKRARLAAADASSPTGPVPQTLDS